MSHAHSRRSFVGLAAGTLLLSGTSFAKNSSGVEIPRLPKFNKNDPKAYGTALATYAEKYDSGWVDQYSKGKMTLFDGRGDTVTREVVQAIMEGERGDKSLVRFMTPADIRGVAALIHEKPGGTDDSWLYLPASRRVRRISGANRTSSFQGTEFTYEDLSSVSVERYTWKFLKNAKANGNPVFELEATPRYKDTGYSRIIISLHQTHFRPEQVVYFDKAGRKLKTWVAANWQHAHGRFFRPLKQTMSNHQTGKKTILETPMIRLNLALYGKGNLKESLFTRRALEGK